MFLNSSFKKIENIFPESQNMTTPFIILIDC